MSQAQGAANFVEEFGLVRLFKFWHARPCEKGEWLRIFNLGASSASGNRRKGVAINHEEVSPFIAKGFRPLHVRRCYAYPVNEDQPIATYREQRFEGKRLFELFPDRVRVRGSVQLQSEFDTTVPLHILNRTPNFIRIRSKSFAQGSWLFIGAIVLAHFSSPRFMYRPRIPSSRWSAFLVSSVSCSCSLPPARSSSFHLTAQQALPFSTSPVLVPMLRTLIHLCNSSASTS